MFLKWDELLPSSARWPAAPGGCTVVTVFWPLIAQILKGSYEVVRMLS